ncbi:tetratricopeptide repeat protein [Frigoriglobus tundricola]|uniref:Tetratricopeptide repeat protein n=1 Tax=Frigoriglobus tundricola TaxID=2774151 RepID=A0A6M5YG63_9BACT|nr:tetratricopeptide repeat protein [Frigoriglobus tundricola]QJW92594.1 hypothetical protein FTUN_0091 [Frigoriglobus tundricola]
MKANLPPRPEPVPEPNAPTHSRRALAGPGRRRLWAAFVLAALAIGAGVWWSHREPPPPEPPLPATITETEVREAVERARANVVADPRSGAAWGDYGSVLLAHLFDHEAQQCFEEAARLAPNDPRWPYARGQIALKRDPANALVLLTAAADAARTDPKFRTAFTLALAEALLEGGEVDRAADLFDREAATRSDRATYGLGLVAVARGDDATAAQRFAAVRWNPSCRKQAHAQLARLARARGDVTAAKQYEAEANAVEGDPPWPDPYLDHVVGLQVGYRGLQRRTTILERDGQFQAAAELYLEQARHERTSKALTGAGINLGRLGRRDMRHYDEAIALLREAVQLGPSDTNAHFTLSLVAFSRAERLWVADPRSAEAAGGFREAIEEARKATELKPDHARAFLHWGLALKNLGDPKAAIEPLRKGLVIRPEEFELHLGLGQALAACGDRAGAGASFHVAQKLDPNDPRPAQELAKLK